MRRSYFARVLLLAGVLFFGQCKNNDDPDPSVPSLSPECSSMLSFHDSSFILAVPTAFTPNGDGHNDMYRIVETNLDSAGFQLSVYRLNGQLVFQTNDPHAAWMGTDMNGAVDTDYLHSVKIRFINPQGQHIDTCTYVYRVKSGPGYCAQLSPADIPKAVFEDQIDPVTGGHPYTTGEDICP